MPETLFRWINSLNKVLAKVMTIVLLLATGASPFLNIGMIFLATQCMFRKLLP
jgi:hypothetical protein